MSKLLFTPWQLRSVTLRNRIIVAPMCQYSTPDGVARDWHMVHLGSRAVGGAGMVMVEASAVSPEGRISPDDLGIWNDAQSAALRPTVSFIQAQGAVAAIQIAHAGRKASTAAPFHGGTPIPPGSERGWQPIGASPLPFSPQHTVPAEMSVKDLERVRDDFVAAAERAHAADFSVLELHMAHGYLLHSFLSPISNQRQDRYGGSLENRLRFPLEVARAVRAVWPEELPLWTRISATDWVPGGWDIEQSVALAGELKKIGVDVIDCSSGGMTPDAQIPAGPGFQVPFAERIRHELQMPTVAVGLITEAMQAEQILVTGQADAVALARELLRNPYWPLQAAHALGVDWSWPPQYDRAKPSR
ncbi:NADH:flavin oxidoreductase/NADH oxidase [Acidithiobacillus sp. CV18-2]|uniref:NADH:flavin oxidoreductase/NADH oxidase n=1 Tax=Igneacidithiobacillus copahuensis TaxID=2724909 RepID=A0AAE3CJ66_9PROT|nr:NADH:flavin oxidoreductase/NADH oxidase [Acidithiobacillus sp. CV18-3]MBU2758438.1 NADH:flavin oxidoreductase/NADH oxidase [Acidithiobacillus sp. BN09-2]MBU2778394.1 NADH:flavin oxidoreductase/NADH oxidase [Acidithiobacillus sp. CV18-2]MBU2787462.1 NADH:flavin oxidoreductase/NADH oxidase [Igneacidithiobacillus copahuensis]MBU2797481.1 NADH:flavin oxidoreductase/NADH oxidase [Acidithiobacillus sp. VAN18-2]MBU2798262.1 NADH:flavin oxidoreductase/NADH oxidase [Acidithiobacillus sp. VAN18-4]UT